MVDDVLTQDEGIEAFHAILDTSWSMRDFAAVHYDAARALLAEQPPSVRVAFSTFASDVRLCAATDRDAVLRSIGEQACEGSTALYDAIVNVIEHEEGVGAPRGTILVVTDGHDTASRGSAADAQRAIERVQRRAGWRVVFAGTEQDALQSARHLGIPVERALTFGGEDGARAAYRSISNSVRAYRDEGTDGFTPLHRQASMGATDTMAPPAMRRSVSMRGH